jgi:ribosomal protein S18 acetylase RimI-like enzyme
MSHDSRPVAPAIHRLTPDDWRTFRTMRLTALAGAPEAFGTTLAEAAAWAEARWRARIADVAQWMAWVDDAPAGTVGLADDELVSMWVDPRARGRGVGDALVATVIAARAGRPLRLWVTVGNEPAIRLYARHGFGPTGEVRPVHPRDPARLELAMALEGAPDLFTPPRPVSG